MAAAVELLMLQFVRLNNRAQAPVYGSVFAAGADLCSAEEYTLPAGERALISTGLQVAIPAGHYGRVAPRSGLALRHGIDVGAGVVDEDYRGELKVLLFNLGKEDFQIKVGDRVAQLICERITRPALMEVHHLESTGRSAGGFGSTGVASTPTSQ